MISSTAKLDSFIKLMKESGELSRRGFELLLMRPDYAEFFDVLKNAGIFDPENNPAPVPAEEEGYVHIGYWSALDYLTKVAELSGDTDDWELASKVMVVVRSVGAWREPDGNPRRNFHTANKLAGIFGLMPTGAVTIGDLDFIPVWLDDRYGRMLLGRALCARTLPRFLESPLPEDWAKALAVLRHCTAIKWPDATEARTDEAKPTMAVDDFSAEQMTRLCARRLGARMGAPAAGACADRVREVFRAGTRRSYSQTYRPTIEDSFHNYRWHGAENFSVEALRDALLGWCEGDLAAAKPFVEGLLTDDLEILRRIGIYIVGQRWAEMHDLYHRILQLNPFGPAHLHELDGLLDEHFTDLDNAEKARTVEAIRQIPLATWGDDPAVSLKHIQYRWLALIIHKGSAPADEWAAQLEAEAKVGSVPGGPDLDPDTGWRVGPGGSPYSAEELTAFAATGVLVERLNAFREEAGQWRGPTIEGLATGLQEAVRTFPEKFFSLLPNFLHARRRFQCCLISGLKMAWEAPQQSKEANWERSWQELISFFEQLVGSAEFWVEDSSEGTPRDWVTSGIVDCLHAGAKADERAYDPALLPRTQALIATLLERARTSERPANDPMTQALNTPKGRVVEALFGQALRACRVGDRARRSHEDEWNQIRPLFEAELGKCRGTNYEFSTLCGAYIAQLCYMDEKWTKEQNSHIFPLEFPDNSLCAIHGLAYASFTIPVYEVLVDSGVLDRALGSELKGRDARGNLLQRVATAYLWGAEKLTSPRFSRIFELGLFDDMDKLNHAFWAVRSEKLSEEQRKLIVEYWSRCVERAKQSSEPPEAMLSSLGWLACFLTTADGREQELLQAVAPYVHTSHAGYEFIGELLRLVEVSPDGVNSVVGTMIQAHVPDYDYNDQLITLLQALAAKGKKLDVISYAEKLLSLSGIRQLYDSLTRSN